ncbi:MAG: GPP34 family phosphoprotein [Candidatus Cloacimonetes bacterium]|nr:GPP34 family phosphoprotein [Candidatus Cloacimonadota bacterium]
MLSFAEELLLLTLDDDKGCFCHISPITIDFALAGAILMDLALMEKIDTDIDNLTITDDSPTGDEIFDTIITLIKESEEPKNALYWIREIKNRCVNLKDVLIERLVTKGILKKEENKFLWVFKQRRYPIINNREKKEVKTRIRELILSDEIPDPKDVVICSLISACNLTGKIFTSDEMDRAVKRMSEIARMDLIGQALSKAINQFMEMITFAVTTAT